eukprot:CAMPEP_0118970330 /NCGR_PEP_ID=MMETSP1173-20130426/7243_1 /TAXON_ID=1034831 /ORGANISM="Rhizochromulina marina cf, Strain CCMP1243" /LENGTH=354 /DNA_ID=CAMNT_0006919681 /DNA_START=46 /DNA_END=1110 /DNA_ORIENTATION=+
MRQSCVAVVLALLAGSADAFSPVVLPHRLVKAAARGSPHEASYLSEIEGEDAKREREKREGKAYMKYEKENAGNAREGLMPTDYDDFIDDEGFDGGDGQVGVVGDGSNAMEQFDMSSTVQTGGARARVKGQQVRGSESKKTRANVFGYTTGYAESLKEKGMTSVDEYGEDKLAQRRQQLENWRNQRELRSQQNAAIDDMNRMTGIDYDARMATQSYHSVLNKGSNLKEDDSKWTMYKGEDKGEEATEAASGLSKGEITQSFDLVAQFPKPAFLQIEVHNDIMSYEDFVVGFSDDSAADDFQVTPLSGQLNRRGGDPAVLSVTFVPQQPGGTRPLYIIVQTEESKFTYHVNGIVQ